MESCPLGTLYALRTRNTYQLASRLQRMLFELKNILQFEPKWFFSRQCFFFPFTVKFAAVL